MTKTGFIYALVDPRHPEIEEYIGWTTRTIGRRLTEHKERAKHISTYSANWIRKITREGYPPQIRLVVEVPDLPEDDTARRRTIRDAEAHWIAHFRALGRAKRNIGNGGEGHDTASAKAFFAALGAAGRSARMQKAIATLGPAGCSARLIKANRTRGAERRSAAARKAVETLGPEKCRARAAKANDTLGLEGRRARLDKANETLGQAGRSARTINGWVTRRLRGHDTVSEAAKAKLRAANTGKKQSAETIARRQATVAKKRAVQSHSLLPAQAAEASAANQPLRGRAGATSARFPSASYRGRVGGRSSASTPGQLNLPL